MIKKMSPGIRRHIAVFAALKNIKEILKAKNIHDVDQAIDGLIDAFEMDLAASKDLLGTQEEKVYTHKFWM